MATRTVAVKLAVENLQASIAALRGAGESGQRELEKIGVGAANSNREVDRLVSKVSGIGGAGRSSVFQQLGYQVGDFAVQVQGGTSALTAFIQQGSQIAGAFGPVGAVVGALGAIVGGLAGAWLSSGEEAKKHSDVLKDVLSPAFLQGADDVREYIKALGEATEAQRRFVGGAAGVQAAAVAKAAGDTGSGLIEGRIGQYRQALLSQVPLLPAGFDFNDEGSILTASRAQASQRSALAEQRVGDLTGRLRQAIDAGDADAVARIIDESGLTRGGDQQTHKLAGALIQDAKEVAANKAKQSAAGYGREYERPVGLGTNNVNAPDTLAISVGKAEAKPGEASRDYVIEGNRKAEEAARQVKARTEQGQRLLQQLTLEADASKRLADATELGTAAVKSAQIANEEERKLLEASRTLKGEQLKQAEELIQSTAERERRQLALNEATKAELALAQERIDRAPASMGGFYDSKYSGKSIINPTVDAPNKDPEAERYADLQRDILIRPWQDMASEVTSITNRMFDDLLTNGKASIGDIAKGFGDVVKQTITGTASNLIMMPVNTAISQVASEAMKPGGDFVSSAKQFGSAHPYLASGALGATGGYLAGSLYGQLTGKQDTYASTGGALGGAAGATLGMFLGGPAGAAAGGLLGSVGGSFLGGLFGGGKMGNDQSRQDYWTTKGKITWSDSSFSPENRAITSGLGGQLAALQESLGGLGATFADVGIKLGAGNKSGITVNGKQYGSQEEALPAALRLLLNSAGGLSGSQQTAIQNTKGRNVQEVLGDVAFAKEFDKLTFKGTEFEAALRDLNEQFDATARRAHDLGLNEQALAEARAKAVERLQTEKARQDRDLYGQYAAAISQSPLEQALIAVDASFNHLRDTFTDAGYSSEQLAQIEAARARAQQDVVKQMQEQVSDLEVQVQDSARSIGSFYDDLIGPLKAANNNAILTPAGQIGAARQVFQDDLAKAQAGDIEATRRLAGSAQSLQGLVSRSYGTAGLGAQYSQEIAAGTSGLVRDLEQEKADALSTMPAIMERTRMDLVREGQANADRIVEKLEQLRRDLKGRGLAA